MCIIAYIWAIQHRMVIFFPPSELVVVLFFILARVCVCVCPAPVFFRCTCTLNEYDDLFVLFCYIEASQLLVVVLLWPLFRATMAFCLFTQVSVSFHILFACQYICRYECFLLVSDRLHFCCQCISIAFIAFSERYTLQLCVSMNVFPLYGGSKWTSLLLFILFFLVELDMRWQLAPFAHQLLLG